MSTAKKIAKNTGFLLASEAARKILFFTLVVYATRSLGTVGWGKFSFTLAYTFLFAIIIDVGLNLIVTREVARRKTLASAYTWSVLTLKAFLACVAYALIAVSINVLGYDQVTVWSVYIMGLSVVLDSFSELFRSIFSAFETMEYVAYSKVIQAFLTVAAGLYLLYHHAGVVLLSVAYLFASALTFAYTGFIVFRKFVAPRYTFDLSLLKNAVRMAFPLIFTGILGTTYYKIDVLMLSFIKGDAAVGIYSAAFQVIGALLFLPAILSTALLPVMARFHDSSERSLKKTVALGVRYLMMLSLPIFLGLTLLSDKVVLFIYGSEFIESSSALSILAWSGLVLFLNYHLYNAINAINKQHKLPLMVSAAVAVNIILNALLIPRYGYNGAAVATTLSNAVLMVIYSSFLRRQGIPLGMVGAVLTSLAPLAVMTAGVIALKSLHVLVIAVAGGILYFGTVIALGGFTREDRQLINEITGAKIFG